MGTSDFAVPTLQALYSAKADLVGVYTPPPRPGGRRGLSLVPSPVHHLATHLGLPVFTPPSLRPSEVQQELQNLSPDFIVVASYGLILPQAVLDIPRYGCINVHPSPLPRWRGAAPLQRTLLHGDIHTALCIIQMDAGVDTGDILFQKNLPVPPGIACPEYTAMMAQEGAQCLLYTLEHYTNLTPKPQHEQGACYAEKISPSEGILDWHKSAHALEQQVRAFSGGSGSWFFHRQNRIRVLKAQSVSAEGPPGVVLDAKNLIIGCRENAFQPLQVMRDGGKPMEVKAFLNGYPMALGDSLETTAP